MCRHFVCSDLVAAAVPQQEGWRAVEACFPLKIAVPQSSPANCGVEGKPGIVRMDLPLLKGHGEGSGL